MTLRHNQKSKPKAGLHQTVRNIAASRILYSLQLQAVEYLRYAAECVSPSDLEKGLTPWCYERVDDLALALQCEPRTILNIERQLEGLGLIERKVMANGHRHAKRCRRTGDLLWVHGISLAPLIARAEELQAIATSRADEERAYRVARQKVHAVRARLKETLTLAQEYSALADLRDQSWVIYDAAPARVTRRLFNLADLNRVHAELALATSTLVEAIEVVATPSPEAGDNCLSDVNISDAAEMGFRHKYHTTPLKLYSCNDAEPPIGGKISNVSDPSNDGPCLEWKCAGGEIGHNPQNRPAANNPVLPMTPKRLLELAPERWGEAIDGMDCVDWRVIGFVATVRRAELGVSDHAWRNGVERMGERSAAICLAILDTNQNHPTAPVRSVGGAFVAMTRRAETGALNLEPSIAWIAARRAGTSAHRVEG